MATAEGLYDRHNMGKSVGEEQGMRRVEDEVPESMELYHQKQTFFFTCYSTGIKEF